jgi:hypothetical protein
LLATASPSTALGRVGSCGLGRCLSRISVRPKQALDGAAPSSGFALDLFERGLSPSGKVGLGALGLHVQLDCPQGGVSERDAIELRHQGELGVQRIGQLDAQRLHAAVTGLRHDGNLLDVV